MSNGVLSRKGMIAILASCMLVMTACSDRKKVKDLEGDNGRLRQQITQLEKEKQTAEEQLATASAQITALEAQVDGLSVELTELKDADKTLAELSQKIQAKKDIKLKLEALLIDLNQQKEDAQHDLEQAEADAYNARQTAQQQMDDANRKMNMAVMAQVEAKKRIAEAEKQEKRIAELQVALDEREAKLDEVARQWRELYSEAKIEAVFDRLTDENKMNDALTFQLSVVALNVDDVDVMILRKMVDSVRNTSTNAIYSDDFKAYPTVDRTEKRVRKLAEKHNVLSNPNAKLTDKILAHLKAFIAPGIVTSNMNDSYLLKTTGSEIIKLRKTLKAYNNDKRMVFVVPRLVEKLSVSMILRVKVNKGDHALSKEEPEQVLEVTLAEPKEVPVDLNKEIDVTTPMNTMFASNKCTSFDAACFSALSEAGMLDKKIQVGSFFDKREMTIKAYLRKQFKGSSSQTLTDMIELDNGRIESNVLGNILAKVAGPSRICTDKNLNEYDCSDELEEENGRVNTVESISLEFAVNQIQDLPSTDSVPVDFAVGNRFTEIARNISNGQLHIQLPIKDDRSVEMNIDKMAEAEVSAFFGNDKATEKEKFRHLLGARNTIFSEFAKGLK